MEEEKKYKTPDHVRAYYREQYRKNAEEIRPKHAAYAREWRAKNPDKVKEANRKQYLRRKELIEKGKLYEDGRSKTES